MMIVHFRLVYKTYHMVTQFTHASLSEICHTILFITKKLRSSRTLTIFQGKKLAKPYARAVTEMLPVWGNELLPNKRDGFESINDLQVHRATTEQIWYPTSESRAFTREDAAKAFDDTLLPADKRIPHPELVLQAKDQKSGFNVQERKERAKQRELETLTKKLAADEKRRAKEAASVRVVEGARWDFKFKNITVESVGKDGRGPTATGWRYGNPHNDRKRGTVKIPTRV
jgi:hypothetical protein